MHQRAEYVAVSGSEIMRQVVSRENDGCVHQPMGDPVRRSIGR